jgi:hypothetical protein
MKLMALKYYDSVSDLKDAGRQTDRQTDDKYQFIGMAVKYD